MNSGAIGFNAKGREACEAINCIGELFAVRVGWPGNDLAAGIQGIVVGVVEPEHGEVLAVMEFGGVDVGAVERVLIHGPIVNQAGERVGRAIRKDGDGVRTAGDV